MSNEFKDRIRYEQPKGEKYNDEVNKIKGMFNEANKEQRLKEDDERVAEAFEYFKNMLEQKEIQKASQGNHKKKRELKNIAKTPRNKSKNSGNKARDIAKAKAGKTIMKVGSVIMATLLAGTAYSEGKKYVENYKDEAAVSSLNAVKEELGADAIYNNSTLTSSNSGIIKYEVVKGGKVYVFEASINEGEITVVRNDGIDSQTRGAISIVAEAQNGGIHEARIANKLVKEIKNGDVNLFVDNEEYLSKRLKENNSKNLEEKSDDEMEIG